MNLHTREFSLPGEQRPISHLRLKPSHYTMQNFFSDASRTLFDTHNEYLNSNPDFNSKPEKRKTSPSVGNSRNPSRYKNSNRHTHIKIDSNHTNQEAQIVPSFASDTHKTYKPIGQKQEHDGIKCSNFFQFQGDSTTSIMKKFTIRTIKGLSAKPLDSQINQKSARICVESNENSNAATLASGKNMLLKGRLVSKNKVGPNNFIEKTDSLLKNLEKLKTHSFKPTSSPAYIIQHQIGKGSYATVYLANDSIEGVSYAVKIYNKTKMGSLIRRSIIANEIEVLEAISHENIVRFYKSTHTLHEIHLIFELVKGISLGSWVRSHSSGTVSEDEARPILRKILNALVYLHSNRICHRDIKLENVLLDADLNPKLIDFGFSSFEHEQSNQTLFCGTPNYMSPEIVSKMPYSGAQSDSWAFGVLCYRILTGNFPFYNPNSAELNKNILSLNYRIPNFLSSSARRVIESLLIIKPWKRVSLERLKNFDFFC